MGDLLLPSVLAHGVGGRSDLPLPLWQVAFGAGVAVVLSFAIAVILVSKPRLASLAEGRPVPLGADRVLARFGGPLLRAVGLGFFLLVLAAALFGQDRSAEALFATNIAPVAVYIVFWQYGQAVAAVFGDVWSALSPFDTLARLGRRVGVVPPDADPVYPVGDADAPADPAPPSTWPAFVGIGGFLWLELAYHANTELRVLGFALLGYAVWVLANTVRAGRGWLGRGEGFTVLFGLLAALSPFFRDDAGRLRVRVPASGLARVRVGTSTSVLILAVLGATSFDGFTRTVRWERIVGDAVGWGSTAWATTGLLVFMVGAVVLFFGAAWLSGRLTGRHELDVVDDHAPSLVPIVLGYTVAHYFSNAVLEGQGFLRSLSDPFGQGWDLFGTADDRIDYLLVTPRTIAWVQVAAIVAGHVVGVLVSHDRALERHPPNVALRGQYPLVAVMVVFTVGGLYLLAG
jgi:hypothetical protein